MDIDILSGLVKDLIMRQDSVALPGVGTFVAEISPATYSDKGYTINPPYRKLSFRQREDGDRSLIEEYTKKNGLDAKMAETEILEFMEGLKEVLFREKTIIFPALGRLRATKENQIFFVPEEGLDIFPDGYGLEPVPLKSHIAESLPKQEIKPIRKEPAPEPQPAEQTIKPESESKSEPGPAIEPEPKPTTAEPESKSEQKPEPEDKLATQPESQKKSHFWEILLWVIVAVVVLSAALALLGRTYPEIIDHILYSAEDYNLIHGAL